MHRLYTGKSFPNLFTNAKIDISFQTESFTEPWRAQSADNSVSLLHIFFLSSSSRLLFMLSAGVFITLTKQLDRFVIMYGRPTPGEREVEINKGSCRKNDHFQNEHHHF